MKIVFFLSCILLFFYACSNKNHPNKEQDFDFFIHGKVKNGANEKLQLNIPSLYPNNTIETTVQDGYYSFKAKVSSFDKGEISIHGKMENFSPLTVYITKDTLQLDIEVGEKFGETTFIADTIVRGTFNQYARQFDEKFSKANSTWIFRDSLKNDSMRRTIYPNIRKQSFSLYETSMLHKDYSIIGLHYLRSMLESNVVYDKKDLTVEEKAKFHTYLQQIDSSLQATADYKIVHSYIEKLDIYNTNQKFIAYTLVDIKGEEKSLAEIISKKQYTLLEFWNAGCIPCRKFNKEGKAYYQQLQEAGIEIISINTDKTTSAWKKASKKDDIAWINLYAGADSPIIPDYNITFYPTSYIFDKHQQLVAFTFKSAHDLLKLLKKNNARNRTKISR